jgi:tetraacyldisaccharide 4'-kinase
VALVAGVNRLLRAAAAVYETGWEIRRRCYAQGLLEPKRVAARVVSVGNLTVGGTGKTTLTLRLARAAIAARRDPAVVCLDYRPGPAGVSDETLLFRAALGEARVFHGPRKLEAARAAATAGHDPVLVDDGFSHWRLARDLDLVLLDYADPWGGGRLLPAGRMREPHRALQRADWLVLTRVPPGAPDPKRLEELRRYAPAARLAAGRHRIVGVRQLGEGTDAAADSATTSGARARPVRVRVVSATGNPDAVAASASESGLSVVEQSRYLDHHWFSASEARSELAAAARAGAVVLLTAKDAVRWPLAPTPEVWVLEVEWEWVEGGAELERAVVDAVGC